MVTNTARKYRKTVRAINIVVKIAAKNARQDGPVTTAAHQAAVIRRAILRKLAQKVRAS